MKFISFDENKNIEYDSDYSIVFPDKIYFQNSLLDGFLNASNDLVNAILADLQNSNVYIRTELILIAFFILAILGIVYIFKCCCRRHR
jgi:hypothetical protein